MIDRVGRNTFRQEGRAIRIADRDFVYLSTHPCSLFINKNRSLRRIYLGLWPHFGFFSYIKIEYILSIQRMSAQ